MSHFMFLEVAEVVLPAQKYKYCTQILFFVHQSDWVTDRKQCIVNTVKLDAVDNMNASPYIQEGKTYFFLWIL